MRLLLTLLPPSVAARRERAARKRVWLGIPLAAAALIIGVYLLLAMEASQARAAARETERLLIPLRPLAVRLSQLQAETEELEARRRQLQGLVGGPRALSILLEDVARSVPPEVWLTSLVIEGPAVSIAGTALSLGSVAHLAAALPASRVLTDVRMVSVQQAAVGNTFVTQFRLTARVR